MSLSELLIANCIALILLAGLLKFYLLILNIYHYHQGLARIHDNARIALHILESEIREAGYIGCAHPSPDFPITNHTTFKFNPVKSVQGTTHSLTIIKGENLSAENINIRGHTLSLSTPLKINVNDTLMISDCEKAEIFNISSIENQTHAQEIHLSHAVDSSFLTGVDVLVLTSKSFYVSETHRKNTRGIPIFALYENENTSSQGATELIEGVEDMQIITAQEVGDWDQVKGVTIKLMLNSIEPATLSSEEQDPLMHRTWETYIALRERLNDSK